MSDDEIAFDEWKTQYFKPVQDFAKSKGTVDAHDFKHNGFDGFCLDAVLATRDIDGETATDADCLSYIMTLAKSWKHAHKLGLVE